MYPRIKRTLLPIIKKETTIEITANNIATEIDDPDGEIFRLCSLANGEQTIPSIAEQLSKSEEDVISALSALDALGFIEDAQSPHHFSQYEMERYRSNFNYYSGFSSLELSSHMIQEKLLGKTVVLLGLGGSSLLAAMLAGMGVGRIVGVDFDQIERSNLNRQCLYSEDDIGKLKTETLKEKLFGINPDIICDVHTKELTSVEDVTSIIAGADLVINMIDQPAILSHRWVNAACVQLSIPYYTGGVNHQTLLTERYTPESQEPCYDCRLIYSLRHHPDSIYRLEQTYGKFFSNINTGFGPNIALLSGLLLSDITNKLTDISAVSKPLLSFDLATMSLEAEDYAFVKLSECPTCGEHRHELASFKTLVSCSKEVTRL